ncbi:MAG TPA: hypothetical protein VFH50_09530 [Acidimicrobiales bacterium]|nr:hypothetical protein [Acidimicrobiales bacterium]
MPGQSVVHNWAHVLAEILEPEENPAGVIYGTIATGALLAAEASRRETLEEAAASVALTLALFWLAHGYAHSLGERLGSGEGWSLGRLVSSLRHEVAILRGSVIPLVVLLLARAAGASTSGAVGAALISAAVLLFVLELIAGVRSRQSARGVMIQVLIGAVLALGILALKVVLH